PPLFCHHKFRHSLTKLRRMWSGSSVMSPWDNKKKTGLVQRVAATSCESYFRHLSRRSNSASLPSPVRRIIDDHNLNHQGASVQEGETMSEPMMETLVQRLGCLEKENLAFKRTNIILIASVAAALLMGQSQCNLSKTGVSQLGKLIEAQEFVVRDANGKE